MLTVDTNVSTRNVDYKSQDAERRVIKDCLKGQVAVKKARTRHLPKPEGWSAERYNAYLKRAHFMNATYRTQAGMTGIVFDEPAVYELDGGLSILQYDVDGSGKTLDQMARDMVGVNVAFGRGGVLADFTATFTDGVRFMNSTDRVVLRHFEDEKIINWRTKNGKLTLLVLEDEIDVDHDGFASYKAKCWYEFRVINEIAHFRYWYQGIDTVPNMPINQQQMTATDLMPLIANNAYLDVIPWAWYGSIDNDASIDPAPLADIANTNIAHYQADADASDSAFIAGQPTLVLTGVSPNFRKENPNGVLMGSGEGIALSGGAGLNPDAKIITAPANTQSTTLLERREKQLAMLGARLVERNGGAKTATQAGADNQTDNSILSLCAANVEACLNKALEYAALFVGGTGSVHINKRYSVTALDATAFAALFAAVQTGGMRMADFLGWQQRNGLIPADANLLEVEQELMDSPTLGMMRAQQMLDAGLGMNDKDKTDDDDPAKKDDKGGAE